MRNKLFAVALGLAALGFGAASTASAHPPGRPGYYGNGPHDLAPHWHKTYTPYGAVTWYGNGPHDLMPHNHSVGPFGGVRSYSVTPFGLTKSYNGFPGYGNYSGSYYGGLGGYPGYGGYPGFGGYSGGFYPW